MVLDLHLIFSPKPFAGIFLEEIVDYVLAVVRRVNFGRVEEEFSVYDVLEHLLVVSVVEGWRTVDHLEDQDAKGPPVGHEGLSLVCDDFRAYVVEGVLT
jgi:hypothetical protein